MHNKLFCSGLLYFPEGALNVDANSETLSDMFRSFHSLLVKIRDLLRILNLHELHRVEKALCTGEAQIKFGAHKHYVCSLFCPKATHIEMK